MNSVVLRAVAANWLRYKRQYQFITFERGPEWNNNPDVYALNKQRFGVEIEIKVSMTDFKKDAEKRKWRFQMIQPQFFYFMVPPALVEKVKPILRDGAGLLTVSEKHCDSYTGLPTLECVVAPKKNPHAKKISVLTAIKMVRHVSGTLCTLATAQANFNRRYDETTNTQPSQTQEKEK